MMRGRPLSLLQEGCGIGCDIIDLLLASEACVILSQAWSERLYMSTELRRHLEDETNIVMALHAWVPAIACNSTVYHCQHVR